MSKVIHGSLKFLQRLLSYRHTWKKIPLRNVFHVSEFTARIIKDQSCCFICLNPYKKYFSSICRPISKLPQKLVSHNYPNWLSYYYYHKMYQKTIILSVALEQFSMANEFQSFNVQTLTYTIYKLCTLSHTLYNLILNK